MRHPFALAAWNTHVGTEMHKDGIFAEARLSGDSFSKQTEQIALGRFFIATGKGSRIARPVKKKKKRGELANGNKTGGVETLTSTQKGSKL